MGEPEFQIHTLCTIKVYDKIKSEPPIYLSRAKGRGGDQHGIAACSM